MKRLVYSPKAYAYVKTDRGLINLSDYITAGSVSRKVNMVSSAELTIRNPDMMWTREVKNGNPIFRPMDPITIWLERIKGYPVQVFTGYLDKTPYLQLYPGVCSLSASCTLKRLLYTYWDPALQFTNNFMAKYGWVANPNGFLQNIPAEYGKDLIDRAQSGDSDDPSAQEVLTDGSIGRVLYAVLKHVGEWDPKTIYVEQLPPDLLDSIIAIYTAYNEDAELVKKNLNAFLKKYIGDGSYGQGSGTGTPSGGGKVPPLPNSGKYTICQLKQIALLYFSGEKANEGAAIMYAESTGDPTVYNGICCWGLWQHHQDNTGFTKEMALDPDKATKKAHDMSGGGEDWGPWEAYGNATYQQALAEARQCKIQPTDEDDDDNKGPVDSKGNPVDKDRIAANASVNLEEGVEVRAARNSDSDASDTTDKIYAPIKGSPAIGAGTGSDYGPRNIPGGSRYHRGCDIPVPAGTPCIAPFDGEITTAVTSGFGEVGGMIHLRAVRDIAGLKKGQVIGWGHVQAVHVKSGQVKAGTHIADSGWHHVHFVYRPDGEGAYDGSADPAPIYKALSKGEDAPASGGSNGSGSNVGSSYQDVLSTAKAAAMVQSLEWPSAAERIEATALTGQKSLLNDKPLMPFIEQLSKASMRNFQSLPNGNFYAFYPDHFGHMAHRQPYWFVDDIEILDAQIELSDDPLATHVFAIGDTIPTNLESGGGIDAFERMTTTGVVNIFNVVQSGFSPDLGPGDQDSKKVGQQQKDRIGKVATNPTEVMNFLKKYGARPHVEEAPMIRSPYFEAFMAYHTFNLLWSRQFLTEVQFTFMPELYPGGLVGFPSHGLQCYIDEVTHTFDYEAGFTTQAQLSAPASLSSAKLGTDPLSFGLVNAGGKATTSR